MAIVKSMFITETGSLSNPSLKSSRNRVHKWQVCSSAQRLEGGMRLPVPTLIVPEEHLHRSRNFFGCLGGCGCTQNLLALPKHVEV
jgi:hypothetical protein